MANSPQRTQFLVLVSISLIGWAVFLLIFRTFWMGSFEPGSALGLYCAWFVLATLVFIGGMQLSFSYFKIPPAQRLRVAVSLSAPAMCCDMLAAPTTAFILR